MKDVIRHPDHYTYGKIECIDYIQDKGFGFCLGNVIKYVTRAGRKRNNSRLQDLKKAAFYLEMEIKEEEKKHEGH